MEDKLTKILFYMHAGAGNHGCEAIVRSLCDVFDNSDITLVSNRPQEDYRYGLGEICTIFPRKHVEDSFFFHTVSYIQKKLFKSGRIRINYEYSEIRPLYRYDYAFSIGGDNYCYEDALYDLSESNKYFNDNNIKTALVGCSVEPELLERDEIVADLNRYSVIIARESRTYSALKGKLQTRVCLLPDPAFALRMRETPLPEGFVEGHTIGLNISPMVINYEKDSKPGITLKNVKRVIRGILEDTDNRIALLPHVVNPYSDDSKVLEGIYSYAQELAAAKPEWKDRVFLVEDRPANELKYIISKCSFLITARTHASIAAYSTCVPTLVVGYSVKAGGIAEDIFGTTEGYVIPVWDLQEEDDLYSAYCTAWQNRAAQKEILKNKMPEYIRAVREYYCNIMSLS